MSDKSDFDKIICPDCCHQFCAVPENVQNALRAAEAQVAALREALKKYDASFAAIGGCGDGGCVVIRPTGMHTNGGCRCMEDRMTARRFGTVTAAFTRAARAALAKGEVK